MDARIDRASGWWSHLGRHVERRPTPGEKELLFVAIVGCVASKTCAAIWRWHEVMVRLMDSDLEACRDAIGDLAHYSHTRTKIRDFDVVFRVQQQVFRLQVVDTFEDVLGATKPTKFQARQSMLATDDVKDSAHDLEVPVGRVA